MNRYKVGIIRVLTTADENVLLAHQEKLGAMFPQFELETRCIHDQYEGIHDDETHNIAVPKIVKLAQEWEKDLDGIIISCAGDPAVDVLSRQLHIPVVGGGKSTAVLSLAGSNKVGIIGIEDVPPKKYTEILKDKIISYEKPRGIVSTNDLQTEEGKQEIINSALRLIELGADTIAFACTGLTTANAKSFLKHLNVRILDAVESEGIMMLAECIIRYQ
ncbi:MAG: aspartate/glutamate racemase family protein [Sedimentibacter sp.]|uniref:aspartate/glutamate racemase family protein n=1 Tax=Sedimentibacter sp. TaxID=1960295 RepID=UPI003159950A